MSNNEDLHNYKNNNQAKKDELGMACSMYVGEQECMWDFGDKVKTKEITRKT
jgi:hypothetical protein